MPGRLAVTCAALTWAALLSVASVGRAQGASPAEPAISDQGAHARPLTGRALVYLDADEGVDEFVRVFLFEVIAGRLREHGLAVTRGRAAASGTPPLTCLADAECARDLQRAQTAPLVLAFHIARVGDELLVTWRRSDAPTAEPSSVQDGEGGVAAALAQTLMELEIERVPCVVLVESELEVSLSVDGARVQSPAVVGPGDHRTVAVVRDRDPWSGPLRCAGGRVLRIGVR